MLSCLMLGTYPCTYVYLVKLWYLYVFGFSNNILTSFPVIKRIIFFIFFFYNHSTGIDDAKKKEIQFSRPHQMYNDVQELLTNDGSPNKVNDNGVSLVSTWWKS